MNTEIAYCGLACLVCSQKETCTGCRDDGCNGKSWCKNYNCCRDKGLNGCWDCDEFPCTGSDQGFVNMLDKLRVRSFARFAKKYGEDELASCLIRNEENGLRYHFEGEHSGAYDKPQTEEDIFKLILHGIE